MNSQLKRMTEGRFKGKFELTESILVGNKAYVPAEQVLTESTRQIIREAVEYQCLAVYTFPVSRPGQKNANGRVYSVDLWQNVINWAQGKSFDGLMDHPDDDSDGSTKDVWCVWRNLRFNEDKTLVIADAYLFGQWGQFVLDKLRAGGNLGLSTVGYGDFLKDGFTVDPEDYELDRPADHVLHPSYGVFGTIEDEVQRPNKRESTDTQERSALREETESQEDKPQGEKSTMNKRETRQFEMMITTLKKQAEAVTDPRRRLEEFRGVLELFDETHESAELRTALEEGIKACETEIQHLIERALEHPKLIQESEKRLSEATTAYEKKIAESTDLGKELETVKIKLESAEKLLDELKEFAKNVKQAYLVERTKRIAGVAREDHEKLREYAKRARSELNRVLGENEGFKKSLAESTNRISQFENQLQQLREAVIARDNKKINEQVSVQAQEKHQLDEKTRRFIESVPKDVKNYVDRSILTTPELEDYRMSLYECKTLTDAQFTLIKLRRTHNEITRISRSNQSGLRK